MADSGISDETADVTEHNAAQIWVWEDDEVVFEAACECGWSGPDRAVRAEAVDDALEHMP